MVHERVQAELSKSQDAVSGLSEDCRTQQGSAADLQQQLLAAQDSHATAQASLGSSFSMQPD